MSQRWGGRFSPDNLLKNNLPNAQPRPPAPVQHPHIGRPKWVTIAATPLLIGAFFQGAAGMVSDLAAFGLIASGMWMTREGLVAQAAYDARRAARRPAIPRKLFGGVLAGLGLGLGIADPGAMTDAALVGGAGLALHLLAFGIDPMRDKGASGVDTFQQDRANRMIDEGDAYLSQMTDAIKRAGDRRLEHRVGMFAATVQHLFDRVRDNPAGLSSARRYMGVYLMGARDATVRFADLYAQTRDAGTRAAYESFLDDLERDFIARADRLLDGDRSALDIEMSVLRERLAREGLTQAATSVDPADRPALERQEAQTLDELLSMPIPEPARRDE
ncbi:5-bromo-4-chloroindolyl phosphate hydrolysis family protein [Paracoccus sp. (in: a-proteobacteria)]|uniref:5-bromo-4-chloroindolyl phosphate hydrolysis family protein n=1 Tax=Paracoccus sp. TaxID=267 RepID=UPI0026DF8E65|nr:5-bromo-4-chloroindolyl phosphate hydrolysis family protein [Paracoccus sp. (in: a-proteobacteria)]MDO5647207.1 5-bromo-4-chloroindolyl phosphate hydrolysis family protein [Paracoccus sp. (in: a-proteobacteria)]